jgi:hypothetical protein
MLTISTVDEALTHLAEKTGREWTRSEFFDIATKLNIALRAVVPIDVLSCRWAFEAGRFAMKPMWTPSHPMLAMLYPHDVAGIWQLGETLAHHAEDRDLPDGELNLLASPIRVTAAEVRIRDAALRQILVAWSEAQSGEKWWRVPEWAQPPLDEKRKSDGEVPARRDSTLADDAPAPWLKQDPRDVTLEPFAPWGVAARYFARMIVKDDAGMLTKRDTLANKVRVSLDAVGIKKRGGRESLDPVTIKKAFSNLVFS